MDSNLIEILGKVSLFMVPFLFALCFHEYAHGWMALRKGDNTALVMGRLSMNPFVHMDPFGTFLLPIIAIITNLPLFGWAKPVPVNPRNLSKPKEDMFWIALAGPLSNLLLAFVGAGLLLLSGLFLYQTSIFGAVKEMLNMFIFINFLLAAFNLIPVHPLDGGKVLARFLPEHWNRWLEDNSQYMNIALIVLFISGGFHYLARPVFAATGLLIGGVQYCLNMLLL